jgi:hypothetical protein
MPLALGLLAAVALVWAFGRSSSSAVWQGTFKGNVVAQGTSVDYTLIPQSAKNVWRLTVYSLMFSGEGGGTTNSIVSPPNLPTLGDAKGWAESEIGAAIVRQGGAH